MSDFDFEEVQVPSGSFVGWGPTPGQVLTIDVLSYGPAAGSDFNGEECPQLVGVLVAPAVSYRAKGTEQVDLAEGDTVTINGGQASLKRNLLAANPEVGDVVRISYDDVQKSSNGHDVKVFSIKVARGAGKGQAVPAASGDLI